MRGNKNVLVRSLQALTQKEVAALSVFKDSNQPEISPVKSGEMFQLFVNGKDAEGIWKINPAFSFGQIVHVMVRDDWAVRREEYQQQIVETAVPQILHTQVESSLFLKDMLAAAIKLHWEPIQRFLQDGNTAHLKGTPLENGASLKQIRDIIDTLQATTGQDKKKVVEHRGGIAVSHDNKRVNSDEAALMLEGLTFNEPEEKKKKKD